MFTFLRKLRNNFYRNKSFSRYLLYAAGEILLVVLGILIALQINTWNNNRILRMEEARYLTRLSNDLRQDLDHLNFVISVNNLRLVRGVEILEELNQNTDQMKAWPNYQSALLDSFEFEPAYHSFGEKLNSLRYYTLFEETDITFQDLIANGKMDIIGSEEVKISILYHYRQLKIKKELQPLVLKGRDEFIDLLVRNGISMTNDKSLEEIENRIQNKEQFFAQLENFLFVTSVAINDLKTDDDSIKHATESLLAQLEIYMLEK